MIKFGVIINPASKHMKKRGAVLRLKEAARGYKVEFEETKLTENPNENVYLLPLKRLLEKNIDCLLVASGDGGHHLVDTALFQLLSPEKMIPQANLRGGTMNVRAQSGELPASKPQDLIMNKGAEVMLIKFLKYYGNKEKKNLKTVNRSMIRIETDGKKYVGFSYSSGLIVKFFEKYYENGKTHAKAVELVMRSTLSVAQKKGLLSEYLQPVKGDVFIDGEKFFDESYNILMVSSQDIMMNFGALELAPKQLQGINENSMLRIIAAKKATRWQLIKQVSAIFNMKGLPRRPLKFKGLEICDATQIKIKPKGVHKFFIDGDFYQTNKTLTITLTKPIPYLTLPKQKLFQEFSTLPINRVKAKISFLRNSFKR
jgi:diacylglycerol kinase family enzyme